MGEAAKIVAQESDGNESSQKAEPGADAGFLWDFWYPAARSSAIQGRRLATAILLEVPLVLGRTDEGKAFAMSAVFGLAALCLLTDFCGRAPAFRCA